MKRKLSRFNQPAYIFIESLFSLFLFASCALLLWGSAVAYIQELKREEQSIENIRTAYEQLYVQVYHQQYPKVDFQYEDQGKMQVIAIE
ncbi:MAG TPA: hypothetical protein IAA34_00490 [Candidatus Enterococcus stercoripullorum]|nr:hypothetical protein [Candidatus Enterococcus stercoripullorum]